MDSFLTLETPSPSASSASTQFSNNFTIPTPNPNPTTTYTPQNPLTTNNIAVTPPLLIPKAEPFDEFFATQVSQSGFSPVDGSDEDHDLYNEFYRVSELFHAAFGQTLNPPHFAAEIANVTNTGTVLVRDPTPDPNVDLNMEPYEENNDRAIVAVPTQEELSTAVSVPRRRVSRVKELVRVSDLSPKEEMHFRDIVRRTRMVYDSLRVFASIEEEKRAAEEAKKSAEEPEPPVVQVQVPVVQVLVPERVLEVQMENLTRMHHLSEEPVKVAENETQTPRRKRGSRIRGDLRAAALMRERNMWLHREKRIVGAIPGICVGDLFLFRMELLVVGLHNQIQAGIDYLPMSMSSNGQPIATSVIVSGGYEDDLVSDDGEVIIYSGHGGQEKNSSRQICDQKLVGGNLAMERSMHYKIEVRVIRGIKYEGSATLTGKVYVYDGLYRIVQCWFDVGKSGFGVYKYKLERIEGQPKAGSAVLKYARDIKKSGVDFNPMYCLSADISKNRESVPVRLFNDFDDNQDPLYYEYLPRTTFPPFVYHQSGKATGCDCVKSCADGCFCSMKNGGEFPYNLQGNLVRGKPLIFECGPFCSCPPNCRNRVSQKGLKNRLEVFRSEETGWGVRTLDIIHAGAFICEFAGVVLTREQAQILTMNGDTLIYPGRFAERWVEWGDLSAIYSDYERPSYPSIPPLDAALDVSRMRNVACYMSHSSSPNVMVQFVLYDHNNLMFPHLMVFAMENIPPMRELSIDYGMPDDYTGKLFICN